jgi:hypothetical protein
MISRLFHVLINPWVVIGILFVSGLCTAVLLISLLRSRTMESNNPPPTAILQVLQATNVYTPLANDVAEVVIIPKLNLPNANKTDGITTGSIVKVVGTGGDGLRLRSTPGLDSKIDFLAIEGETYQVEDGPQLVSGYTWYYLVATIDEKVKGWAVADFIVLYQNP